MMHTVVQWIVVGQCIWLWWLVITNVRAKRTLRRELDELKVDRAEFLAERLKWLDGERKAALPRLAKITGMSELQAQAALDAADAAAWEEFQNRTKGVQK